MASEAERTELERIRRSYERYATDPRERARRDRTNAGLVRVVTEWQDEALRQLSAIGLVRPEARVLDLGCGEGRLLGRFVEAGVRPDGCLGVDLMPARVEAARRRFPSIRFVEANAASVPAGDGSFDVVTLGMVLSSILDRSLAEAVCSEARRVLAAGGAIVCYDTRYVNPLNRDVRAVPAREVRRLFPGMHVEMISLTLLPPLARRLGGPRSRLLYRALDCLPPLRARLLALIREESAR